MDNSEMKDRVLISDKSDMQKLKEVFDLDKEWIRKNNIQLYYAILGMLDSIKIGNNCKNKSEVFKDNTEELIKIIDSTLRRFSKYEIVDFGFASIYDYITVKDSDGKEYKIYVYK